jgi:hypothetical protein
MNIQDATQALGLLQDLVKAIKLAWDEGRGIWTAAQIRPIVDALRTVYFPPSGSLDLLDKVADGKTVSASEAKIQLTLFEEGEPTVQKALKRLEYKANHSNKAIPLEVLHDLDVVSIQKVSVRRSVHSLLSRLANGEAADQQEVAKLVDQIKTLNTSVNQLDAALNKWKP